jgi:DNA-binding response OmpR family regulator
MKKTVLVADDDPDVTQSLAMRLKQLGLSVVRSPDATHALVGVQKMRPDLVILDVNMPGGNGLAVAEMLASDAEFRKLPVIIYTGRDDLLTRIRCMDPRHYYVQKSPDSWDQIKSIVCKELKLEIDSPRTEGAIAGSGELPSADAVAGPTVSETQEPAVETKSIPPNDSDAPSLDAPQADRDIPIVDAPQQSTPAVDVRKRVKVLCIDDDPDISKVLKIRLAAYNVEVLRAFNGMHGYWTAVGERPDAIICDMSMPEGDGNYIFSRLKSHPLTQDVPVIVLTGQRNPALKRTMLSLGVEAYLEKPLIFDELLRGLRGCLDLPEHPVSRDYERVSSYLNSLTTVSEEMAEAP